MKVHPDEAGACNTAIGASLTENRTKLPRHLQYFFALGGQGVFSTFVLPATISCNQSITFSQNAPRQVQLTLNKTQDGAISSILIRQEITQPLETPQNKTPIITVPITFESHISTNPSGSRTIETAYTAGEPAVQVNRIENQARARILKAVFQGGATHSGTLEP